MRAERDWLRDAQSALLAGNADAAEAILTAAIVEYSHSFELRRTLAAVYQRQQRLHESELAYRELLRERPGDAGTASALAPMLIEANRGAAAAEVMLGSLESTRDPEWAIHAIELLDAAHRKAAAALIAETAVRTHPNDSRLRAYAGMLQLQLGKFEQARQHYLIALKNDPLACEWRVPHGIAQAQRYREADHPDFALFRKCLSRADLSAAARASLLFALGKAHDDIEDFEQAAHYFRDANAFANAQTSWSRKQWRRSVEARLSAPAAQESLQPRADFIPIFIVGMPRSGTTLVAESLTRYPGVCNRGEVPWLANLWRRSQLAGSTRRSALDEAARDYVAYMRQDDSGTASWFIDKEPLNFRYIDLALAMFPNAKIVYCTRSSRATGLSLWMQSFSDDIHGYSYAFDGIQSLARDCQRLMVRWRSRFPDAIREVRYEEWINSPESSLTRLANWLHLPALPADAEVATSASAISTASLWQARQPIYTHALNRWTHYLPFVPELLRLPAD